MIYLFVCLFVCLFACLFVCLFLRYTTADLRDCVCFHVFNHSCPHQFFADDTQLRKSRSPEHYDDTRNDLQTCISDIKNWMTENKLQLNAYKTETTLSNSSKLKHPPAPLSFCQATISFSDSVRNLGFYLYKDFL